MVIFEIMKRTAEERELIAYCKKYRKNQRVIIRGLGECKVYAWHPSRNRENSRIEVQTGRAYYSLQESEVISC